VSVYRIQIEKGRHGVTVLNKDIYYNSQLALFLCFQMYDQQLLFGLDYTVLVWPRPKTIKANILVSLDFLETKIALSVLLDIHIYILFCLVRQTTNHLISFDHSRKVIFARHINFKHLYTNPLTTQHLNP